MDPRAGTCFGPDWCSVAISDPIPLTGGCLKRAPRRTLPLPGGHAGCKGRNGHAPPTWMRSQSQPCNFASSAVF